MDQTLDKLFESSAKTKLLRFFLMNTGSAFSHTEISRHTRLKPGVLSKELSKLLKIGLVRPKLVSVKTKKNKPGKKVRAFATNSTFPLYQELKNLILKAHPASGAELARRLQAIGGVKLALSAGVFMNAEKSRVDMLIVGDKIERAKFRNFLARIESEIGKELRYVLLSSEEFRYRMNMYDRFLRDILEFPHEKVINKLNV